MAERISNVDAGNFTISGRKTTRPTQPFAGALYDVAQASGFRSQLSLAKALGHKRNAVVNDWFLGKNVPTPENMGRLLEVLDPTDVELDQLMGPYSDALTEGKGNKHYAGTPPALEAGRKRMRFSDGNGFGDWLKAFCIKNQISVSECYKRLGEGVVTGNNLDNIGFLKLSRILSKLPEAFELEASDMESLAESVTKTIQTGFGKNPNYGIESRGNRHDGDVKAVQKTLPYQTYTGAQAAREFGVTRERIRQMRQEYGWPYLLGPQEMRVLEEYFSKSRNVQYDSGAGGSVDTTPPQV